MKVEKKNESMEEGILATEVIEARVLLHRQESKAVPLKKPDRQIQ